MYNVELNKTVIQNHIRYDWWKYALIILFTIIIWNGVTNYRINKAIPEDERMDIFLVGDYIYNDTTEDVSKNVLESVEGLQKLNFINIPLSPIKDPQEQAQGIDPDNDSVENKMPLGPQMNMANQQRLVIMIGTQSGDVFIFDKDRYEIYAEQGAFLDIEGYLGDIDKDLIDKDALDNLRIKAEDDDIAHLYGLPAKGIKAFEGTGYDVEDKVICIMAYSKKPEKAWDVTKWLLKGNS